MQSRIYLLVIVFAAGMVAAMAEETKTNAAPGVGGVAVPPPVAAPSPAVPAAANGAKTPAAGTLTPTSPVPIQPKITATPRMSSSEGAATGDTRIVTNPPPPASAVTEMAKPPGDISSTPTSTVPAEADVPVAVPATNVVALPPEISGIDRKSTLLIGGAILVVAGGLAIFMWRRARVVSHGSLISSALNLVQSDDKTDDRAEEKAGEKSEAGTEVIGKPKAEEKKFPPPMN